MSNARTNLRNGLAFAIAATLVVTLALSRPAIHLLHAAYLDRRQHTLAATPAGFVDDASHLNQTRVRSIVDISADDLEALGQIRGAFTRARQQHLGVSIAGFRHSMGGQTIAPGGIVLNMLGHDSTRYDRKTENITVGAGATWDLVVPYLDHFGRAVAVMQSDSNFSVGGSLSVNCHGWQPRSAPIASTVESLTVVTPDGALRHCSRTENPELFSHVLGGYGLFGVILDAELRTVPNELYRAHVTHVSIEQYEALFDRLVRNSHDIGLAYGRVGVGQDRLFGDALITTFVRVAGEPPPLKWYEPLRIGRYLFRGSLRSGYGKRLRWWSELHLSPIADEVTKSRNDVMDQDIDQYINYSADERDILEEYFVPRGHLAPFLRAADRIIHRHDGELLNITIRDVRRDTDTALPYARSDVFAVVMFFEQRPTAAEESRMEAMTQGLIDLALAHGGTYYLPYRLHATPAQFRAAYPQCRAFFETKRRYDRDEVLRNSWYEKYSKACE